MRMPLRVHSFWPSQKGRRPSYFSLIHHPVGSMDGFQTFASSKGGALFSTAELAAATSFSFAARLQVRKRAVARTIAVALNPGGIFMPRRLSDFHSRCQASARAPLPFK